jgi:hypothetical protein
LAVVDTCAAMDGDADGTVAINELIAAVNRALSGCPTAADDPQALAAAPQKERLQRGDAEARRSESASIHTRLNRGSRLRGFALKSWSPPHTPKDQINA